MIGLDLSSLTVTEIIEAAHPFLLEENECIKKSRAW